jgi:hypothetical protein
LGEKLKTLTPRSVLKHELCRQPFPDLLRDGPVALDRNTKKERAKHTLVPIEALTGFYARNLHVDVYQPLFCPCLPIL